MMLDPAIDVFFAERKEGWLKKKLKPNMTDEQKREIEIACEEEFSLEKWLPDAARRASQISISTHPCTFSHPSARKNKNGYVTSVIAKPTRETDGYLRTGNIDVQTDALGNAAALDVHKFLSLITADGSSVIEHIQQDTELSKSLLNIQSKNYTELKAGFLAMVQSDITPITSSKIKQVFFPVDNGNYHQFSILSNSGIVFELRKRIDALRFSDRVKEGREARRNNHYFANGFSEIYNITTIGYGGTKPQNISVLNNQNGGKAHLLLSVPPNLEKREVKFPKKDFFIQSLRYYDCKAILERLDNIFKIEREGNIPLEKIRKGRDRCLGDILDVILQKMIAIRNVSSSQFWPETNTLPAWQKLWLSEHYKEAREEQDEWLDTLCHQVAVWINNAYKKSVKLAVLLGKEERAYIEEFISENKDIFR
jgi:CRISPR-associated protein Csy1